MAASVYVISDTDCKLIESFVLKKELNLPVFLHLEIHSL